jgi:hypothetical protein
MRFEQDKFSTQVLSLLSKNRFDRSTFVDFHSQLSQINRLFNTFMDIIENPELAKKNCHHPADDLVDMIIAGLITLEIDFETCGNELKSEEYFDLSIE